MRRIVRDDGEHGVVQIAIGVHDGNDGDGGIFRFLRRMPFVSRIDDDESVGTFRELRDTAKPLAESLYFAIDADTLEFSVKLHELARFALREQVGETIDAFLYLMEIRDGAAKPPSCDVRGADTLGRFRDGVRHFRFAAHEKNDLAVFRERSEGLFRGRKLLLGFREIEDLKPRASAKNERLH